MSDKHTQGDNTTGHVWDDDLADLTNQPPKWWMLGLAASAIFVVVYFMYYPSVPMPSSNDHFKGVGGWSAIKELEADVATVDDVRAKYEAKLTDMTPAQILADADLSEYVKRSGKVLFGDNCGACHGPNGIGVKDAKGYMAPVLNDDDWLYGGTVDSIHESIKAGRMSMMMGFKDQLSEAELDELAQAIAKSQPTSTPLFAEKGCSGCHGAEGEGMEAMGAAKLTDQAWRFDSSVEGIKYTIAHGVNNAADPETRGAEMPAFEGKKLTDNQLKKLAVYVYQLGGGVADTPVAVEEPAPAAEETPVAEDVTPEVAAETVPAEG